MLVAGVALVAIGPKDLPRAMRFVGQWVGRGRRVMQQFRASIDTMIQEAELKELEQKWAEENARIMRDYPPPSAMMPLVDPEGEHGAAALTPPPVIAPPPSHDEIEAALGVAPSHPSAPGAGS